MKEQLYTTPISPRNIAEGAINLYREYFDRMAPDFDPEEREELEEAAMRAALSDTMEGVEADVSVPEYDEYEETEQDKEAISRIMAEYEARNQTYYCAVCRTVPVDAFNGWDTCPDCAKKI